MTTDTKTAAPAASPVSSQDLRLNIQAQIQNATRQRDHLLQLSDTARNDANAFNGAIQAYEHILSTLPPDTPPAPAEAPAAPEKKKFRKRR